MTYTDYGSLEGNHPKERGTQGSAITNDQSPYYKVTKVGCLIAVALLATVYAATIFAEEHASKSLRLSATKGQTIEPEHLMQVQESRSTGNRLWFLFIRISP